MVAAPEQRAHQAFHFAELKRSIAIIFYPVLERSLTFKVRQISERARLVSFAEIISDSALEILDNILYPASTKLTRRVLEEC